MLLFSIIILSFCVTIIQFDICEEIIMGSEKQSNYVKQWNSIYVLEQHSPDDVARAMIENGHQTEPFYLFNIDEVYRRIQHMRRSMPRVRIFYAMKVNNTDILLRLAATMGLGFDCASPGEINKIRQLNTNPRSIIYSMPCKTPREMEYARQIGVRHATFDSSAELKKMKEFWPDVRLLLRIRVDGKVKIVLGEKFGCNFDTEAISLLEEAAALKLNVVGVAFHVGALCFSPETYVLGVQKAKMLFDHEARAGRKMTIVDIGGGFRSDRMERIDEVSQLLNESLEELFPDPEVQIIAEPGRYICDSAFTLYTSVIGEKRGVINETPVNMIYLSDGKYGTMKFDEKYHDVYKFKKSTDSVEEVKEDVILWGPTCDSLDRIRMEYEVKLPNCSFNDWLVFKSHGAYSLVFSSNFSSIEMPLVRSVISKELWNSIKNSQMFSPSEFVLNMDISVPLPSSLPAILPTDQNYENSLTPVLNV